MIRIEHLTKRFGRTRAVEGASLTVPAGGAVALWGTNGAGKTTILRCVLGLLRYQGRITIAGLDARRHGKRTRRLIGYVPQELGFNDDLRIGDAVAYFARLKGVTVGSVAAVLARVGLEGHARKRMRELSGGMKQRLALAIALLGDPPVLVLDEVTASLDACGREELVALLRSLKDSGKSLLFASHRTEEVAALADRIVTLEGGRIVSDRPAAVPAGPDAMLLHLHIHAPARPRAIELLRAGGFAPSLNGVGLLVPVAEGDKAAPFHVLSQGSVHVTDFQVLRAADGHATRQEAQP